MNSATFMTDLNSRFESSIDMYSLGDDSKLSIQARIYDHQPSSPILEKDQSWKTTVRIPIYIVLWYATSVITNNLNKVILNLYPYPITLTWVQFFFAAFYSVITSVTGNDQIQPFTTSILIIVFPLCGFQIAGHVLTTVALSFIPVSFVHTIKGLSPLFAVAIAKFYFGTRFSPKIYISLVPLTLGVMMACSSEVQFNFKGFMSALLSTFVFVVQNYFSKGLFQEKRMNKVSFVFYASSLAFVVLIPAWLWTSGSPMSDSPDADTKKFSSFILGLYALNGLTHFGQNFFALSVLSLVSPLAYSIASLGKRLIVITGSMIYFGNEFSFLKMFGVLLSIFGIYLYNMVRDHTEHSLPK